MTKEEILAMEAGRDLDWLICTEVFESKTFGSLKPYSTDISAAWQVRQRMSELGYTMSLLQRPDKVWYCDFRPEDAGTYPPGTSWVDHTKEAPEAICKAALLTKWAEGE